MKFNIQSGLIFSQEGKEEEDDPECHALFGLYVCEGRHLLLASPLLYQTAPRPEMFFQRDRAYGIYVGFARDASDPEILIHLQGHLFLIEPDALGELYDGVDTFSTISVIAAGLIARLWPEWPPEAPDEEDDGEEGGEEGEEEDVPLDESSEDPEDPEDSSEERETAPEPPTDSKSP